MKTSRQDSDNIPIADEPGIGLGYYEKSIHTGRSGFSYERRDNVKVMTIVEKSQLINRINQVNFLDGTLKIDFKHTGSDRSLTCYVKPDPCLGDVLYCKWCGKEKTRRVPDGYVFKGMYISLGGNFLVAEPELYDMDAKGCRFVLPETCYELQSRKVKRHKCEGIKV
jgi:hypothetical protein